MKRRQKTIRRLERQADAADAKLAEANRKTREVLEVAYRLLDDNRQLRIERDTAVDMVLAGPLHDDEIELRDDEIERP